MVNIKMNQFLYDHVFCGIDNNSREFISTWTENLWCINLNEYDYWGCNQGFNPGHTWNINAVKRMINEEDVLRLK